MRLQSSLIKIAYQWKPLLLQILPVSWLRRIKNRMVHRNFKKLDQMNWQPFDKKAYPKGVNLIGNIRAETGLGQSCRLVANELAHCRFPMTVFNYQQSGNFRQSDQSFETVITKECFYGINLIHINPHELGIALMQLEQKLWDKHYNIGFWLWELEEFPDEWLPCIRRMDEIWTPSEFISRAIRKKTKKPVVTIPYAIEAQMSEQWNRKNFGLPEKQFLFLMIYDNNSIPERKNPQGVIRAFQQAFPKNSKEENKAGLVIKMNSANGQQLREIEQLAKGYKTIYLITELMPKEKVNSLIACVDAVISLHRAEGFGLVLAEAMFLEKPVIATNWSANTEFMNDNVACMIDFSLTKLNKTMGPFQKGQRWAEPDLCQAASMMKKLVLNPDYCSQLAADAKLYIQEKLGMQQAVEKIEKRVEEILQNH